MTEPILVFVNDRGIRVPAGTSAAGAIAEYDAALAEGIRAGAAYLTDGRGIRLEPDSLVFAGAIIRVVSSARQVRDEADAHP